MTNPIKGEVGFEADGKNWILSFGINAIIELEQASGRKINELLADLQPKQDGEGKIILPDFVLARQVFRAALSDHHDDVTEKQAGRLISALGLAGAFEKLGEAVKASFPDAEAGDDAAAGPRTRRTKGGTG